MHTPLLYIGGSSLVLFDLYTIFYVSCPPFLLTRVAYTPLFFSLSCQNAHRLKKNDHWQLQKGDVHLSRIAIFLTKYETTSTNFPLTTRSSEPELGEYAH